MYDSDLALYYNQERIIMSNRNACTLPEPFALLLSVSPRVSDNGQMQNAPTANDSVNGMNTYTDDF